MSAPAFVVMPVGTGTDGPQNQQDTAKMAQAIQQSVYEQTHPKPLALPAPERPGPLKEILAKQESLYKYVSWEDPLRTIGSYIALVSLLVGAHYMPLTRWALKAGVYIFGAVCVTEFANRAFGPDTFLSRLRPKPYKKVPEPVLDATLKDIHDFVQYCAVSSQRVLYGEDLNKTFAVFLGFTAMYWLIGVASPFALSLIGVTSLYIAPLVLSPQSRELAGAVAQDGAVLAKDLANAAAESGKSAIESGKSAMESGKATVNSGLQKGKETVNSGLGGGKAIVNNGLDSGKAKVNSGINMASNTATQVADQAARARGTAV